MNFSNPKIFLILPLCIFLSSCGIGNKAHFEQGYFIFNGEKYVETSGVYDLGHKICRSSDGWTVYDIVGDDMHNYLEVSSFLDNYLYVRENFSPDHSKIISVGTGTSPNNSFNDEKMIETVNEFLEREQIPVNDDNILGPPYVADWICIYVKYKNDAVGHIVGYLMVYKGKNVFYTPSNKTIVEVSEEEMHMFKETL